MLMSSRVAAALDVVVNAVVFVFLFVNAIGVSCCRAYS